MLFRSEPAVRAFTADDVESMISAAGDPPTAARSAWPLRDQAIIDLLASTGTRNGECVALRIGDIAGADRPVLHIQRGTKSGRTREVPLPAHTTRRLMAYLAGDFDASDRALAKADPAQVAEGAKILDDPSFGAGRQGGLK